MLNLLIYNFLIQNNIKNVILQLILQSRIRSKTNKINIQENSIK